MILLSADWTTQSAIDDTCPVTALALSAKVGLTGMLLVVAAAPTVTLTAPTHTPKINTRWYYTVRATQAGKPAAGRLTAQIVDPIGGSHPVQFGTSTKNITNWPFRGRFRDFIIWPASSRGIPLRLRVVVKVGGAKRTVSYAVTPER